LEELGAWTSKHSEAIYTTQAGLPSGLFYGSSTLSQDRKTLYLIFFDIPRDQIAVRGLRNKVLRASVVGSDEQLSHRSVGGAPWMSVPGVLWIDVPERVLDENATVIRLELDGELDLYTGSGHAIEVN
jgi:alpha-L-fucosidase